MDPPAPQPEEKSPQPLALHQDDADEDDQSVKQLQECSTLYLHLQDCLIKNDRNWKSCQMEVKALKGCNEKRMKSQEEEDSGTKKL